MGKQLNLIDMIKECEDEAANTQATKDSKREGKDGDK